MNREALVKPWQLVARAESFVSHSEIRNKWEPSKKFVGTEATWRDGVAI